MAYDGRPQRDDVSEPTWGNRERPDREGLGVFLGDASDAERFGHIGDDPGFQAQLIMFADSGRGAVILANSERGIFLGNLLLAHVAREYGWRYRPSAAVQPSSLLIATAGLKGTSAAMEEYHRLKVAHRELGRETLIALGYELSYQGKLAEAIEVMKDAVNEEPDYWNAYDSLAELYAKAGQTQLAIDNYQKAVQLRPENANGIEMIRRLRALPMRK